MNQARGTGLAPRLAPLSLLAVIAALPFTFGACGGSKPAATAGLGDDGGAQCAPGQYCPPSQACAPGQYCPPSQACAPGQYCPPQPASADPNALAQLVAAAAAAGSAWLTPMGMGDPVELGLRTAAAKYAPGMSPEGQVAKGNIAEGGHIGFVVNMEPNKCYTIVGFGSGVQDLDLMLLAPPFYTIPAGQDGMAGPNAVIGAAPKPMCPIAPITVPYKVDIYAKKGGGMVGAQVFSKPK